MFRFISNDFGLVCTGVSDDGGYKRNTGYNLSCLLATCCHLSNNEKP